MYVHSRPQVCVVACVQEGSIRSPPIRIFQRQQQCVQEASIRSPPLQIIQGQQQRELVGKCNHMDIDIQPQSDEDSQRQNDVLSAMLKRQTRPRNWGMTEMTQLIKIYELSGGARKNMNDAYKKIELNTGTKKRAAREYLTYLRKPVDNPTPEDTLLLEFFALKETQNKRERDQSLDTPGMSQAATQCHAEELLDQVCVAVCMYTVELDMCGHRVYTRVAHAHRHVQL